MSTNQTTAAPGIDPLSESGADYDDRVPYNVESFERIGVGKSWQRYDQYLTWGRGQCLAILDDGCDINQPAWQAALPWGPKVIATWDAINQNDNCAHQGRGYHGTSVGYPSSIYLGNARGIAYNNFVAHVRSCSVVHLPYREDQSIASGLQWVLDNHQRLNITTVNLAPVDDVAHSGHVASAIDDNLRALREANIWVSSPTANNDFQTGISWPACANDCFAIGGVHPERFDVYRDRYRNVDLLACARATSSSNAYAAACAMIAREAIDVAEFPWQNLAGTLPDAIMKIFQLTGRHQYDTPTGLYFRELNLAAALHHIFCV